MDIKLTLNSDQARQIAVNYIANAMITNKQYLSKSELLNYQFMLNEFASLVELEDITKRFNKSWPADVQWYNIGKFFIKQ